MTAWTNDELNKIGSVEELLISPQRADGTLRKAVIIWVVRVDNDLYVRCANGSRGPWYRAVQARHAGRIQAGGVAKDVTFVDETDPGLNQQVDAAYLDKYRRYPQYVAPMVTPEVRTTTIRLLPAQ